jgi:hypothetical protein
MLDRHGEAYAAGGTPPKRFIVGFAGQALGANYSDPPTRYLVPDRVGRDYDLKLALEPLAPVKDQVTVVSGLRIPSVTAGAPPEGGWSGLFHNNAGAPLLTGLSSSNGKYRGPTADQVAVRTLDRRPSLDVRVQTIGYNPTRPCEEGEGGSNRARITYGQGGKPINPVTSTEVLFNALFSAKFITDPAAQAELGQRKRVVDLVRDRARALAGQLGAGDRQRLQAHLAQIDALESSLGERAPAVAACRRPERRIDPEIGCAPENRSGETVRARLMCDYLQTALACDLRRVGSIMFTMFQSYLSAGEFIPGERDNVHQLSHSRARKGDEGGTCRVSRGIAWHMGHFAHLIDRLARTPEADGSLLDHTVLVFLFEGGWGGSPERDKKDDSKPKDETPHSTENMVALIAGGRACGLAPGRHLPAPGKHPGQVLVSALDAVGVFAGGAPKKLGEVSGVIPELFA